MKCKDRGGPESRQIPEYERRQGVNQNVETMPDPPVFKSPDLITPIVGQLREGARLMPKPLPIPGVGRGKPDFRNRATPGRRFELHIPKGGIVKKEFAVERPAENEKNQENET